MHYTEPAVVHINSIWRPIATRKMSSMIYRMFLAPSLRQFTSTCSRNATTLTYMSRSTYKPLQPKTACLPYINNMSRTLCNKQEDTKFVQDLKSSPPPALWLGFSGAIPFAGLAGMSFVSPEYLDIILHAQCGYGACILSFLGAIHWGYALSGNTQLKPIWGTLMYSVTPSLVAWLAMLIKPQFGLVTIATGLLFTLSKDLGTLCFPGWYHALRKVLTTIAASSLLLTAAMAYMQ